MNRRGFLAALTGGVVAGAAVRTWPFRVFSFPTDIVIARPGVQTIAFVEASEYVTRIVGLRIPLRIPNTGMHAVSQEGSIVNLGPLWKCFTVYTPEELDTLIAEHRATQGPAWEQRVRAASLWTRAQP